MARLIISFYSLLDAISVTCFSDDGGQYPLGLSPSMIHLEPSAHAHPVGSGTGSSIAETPNTDIHSSIADIYCKTQIPCFRIVGVASRFQNDRGWK